MVQQITVPPKGTPFKVGLSLSPSEPIAMAFNLDFTQGNVLSEKDLFQEQSQMLIPFVQSIFIDNSLNGQPIAFAINGSQQKLQLRANWQAYLPVLGPEGQFQFVATTTGALIVPIFLLSFMVPYVAWPAS